MRFRKESLIAGKAKENQGTRTDILEILPKSIESINTREQLAKEAEINKDVNISTDIVIKHIDDLAMEIKLLNIRLDFILESLIHDNQQAGR